MLLCAPLRCFCAPCAAPRSRWRCLALSLPLQDHIDYMSLHALLVKQQGLGIVGQIKSFWQHTKRLAD